MCTGNFYCDEISTQAVLTIAEYLDIQPQLVDEVIHSFTAYEMPWDIVAEQNLYPKHPQKAYRELLAGRQLWIFNGHAGVESERD